MRLYQRFKEFIGVFHPKRPAHGFGPAFKFTLLRSQQRAYGRLKFMNRPVKPENLRLSRFLLAFTIATPIVLLTVLICGMVVASRSVEPASGEISRMNIRGEPKFHLKEHLIEPGETFSKLTVDLGLNAAQTAEIIQISEDVYDLAKIRAGNVIRAFFDLDTNQFQKLEYEINEDNILIVEKTNEGLAAKKIEIEYEIELTSVFGIIEDSLYQSAKASGLSDKTIIELADIFAWDIDFGFDVRVGDRFDILYEKRFLDGELARPGKILVARYQNEDEIHWGIYYHDLENREDYYDLEGNCLRRLFLRSPLQYKYISSGFSYKRMHPILGRYTKHLAIDYAAPTGTPVSSAGNGTVIFTGWKTGIGKTVIIRHNEIYTTRYSHLSAYGKGIKYGAKVEQSQIIGYVGSTGEWSTGPHLEYAMTRYGTAINPLLQKFDKVEPINDLYRQDFDLQAQELLKLLEYD